MINTGPSYNNLGLVDFWHIYDMGGVDLWQVLSMG